MGENVRMLVLASYPGLPRLLSLASMNTFGGKWKPGNEAMLVSVEGVI